MEPSDIRQGLRSLAPRPAGGSLGGEPPRKPAGPPKSENLESRSPPRRRVRHPVSAACTLCRRRKIKCNGERPVCRPCATHGRQCVYTGREGETGSQTLRRESRELSDVVRQHESLYRFLQTRNKRDIGVLIERIQSGEEIGSLLRTIDDADLLLGHGNASPDDLAEVPLDEKTLLSALVPPNPWLGQQSMSFHTVARQQLPRTSSAFIFELSAQHQVAYPILLPLDVSTLSFDPFRGPEDTKPTARLSAPPASLLHLLNDEEEGASSSSSPPSARFPKQESPSTAPDGLIHLAGETSYALCDDRLERISIRRWIDIPISDHAAAMLISSYLTQHHPIVGYFDADLFLDDLLDQMPRFCSPFLTCAVLLIAAYGYTVSDRKSAVLCQSLFGECESLFRRVSTADICSLAAINVFSFGCLLQGNDKLAHELLTVGRQMGLDLHLYGTPSTSHTAKALSDLPADWKRATAHAAWGAYSWLTIHELYYDSAPIAFPPALPIPGNDQERDVDGGPVPSPAVPPPSHEANPCSRSAPRHAGKTFAKLCELLTIVQEVAVVYKMSGTVPVADRVPLMFVEAKYQKLLAWMDSLGMDWTWNKSSPYYHLVFHMWFHCSVLDIFRPFLQTHGNQRLESFTSPDATPRAIFVASITQLQRMAVIHHEQEAPAGCPPWVSASVLHIANTVIKDATNHSSKYYFMLCFRYLQRFYVAYPVYINIAKALVAIAVANGVVTRAEAALLVRELEDRGRHHVLAQDKPTSSIIVDYDVALAKRADGQAQVVADKLKELLISDEPAEADT